MAHSKMSGYRLVILVFARLSIYITDAAITPEVASYKAEVGKDFTLPWEYDNETEMFTVEWSYKNSSATLATNIMSQDKGSNAVSLTKNVEHIGNGNIKLRSVKTADAGIYYCAVTYDVMSGLSSVTGTATLSVTSNNKVEIIVGSVVGGLAGVGCIVGVVFLIWKYKCKKTKYGSNSEAKTMQEKEKMAEVKASKDQDNDGL